MASNRLEQQFNFLHEIDKLKTIYRKSNLIADPGRLENTAEHSWHLAFYVLILSEYTNAKIDLLKTLKMVLLHDLVEIDAGDTFAYAEDQGSKQANEQQAAQRIFGLLPADQRDELHTLWLEFEAGESAEAKFAASVDRMQPMFNNYLTGGGSWKRHNIKRDQVNKRAHPIQAGSKSLAEFIDRMLDDAVESGLLAP